MNLDEHKDYFLDEDEHEATPASGTVIDFTPGRTAIPAKEPERQEKPRSRHRGRKFFAWFIVIVIIVLAGLFYVRYLNPYAVEARTTGYVTDLEKRGIIFKTFEGTMATESALGDSSKVYARNFTFTVPDTLLARRLQDISTGSSRKVTLVYERYYGMLPWRGGSTNVVTAVIEN